MAYRARRDWTFDEFERRLRRTTAFRDLRRQRERVGESTLRQIIHLAWLEHLRVHVRVERETLAPRVAEPAKPVPDYRKFKAFVRHFEDLLAECEDLFGEAVRPGAIARWYGLALEKVARGDIDRLYERLRQRRSAGAKRDPQTDAMAEFDAALAVLPVAERCEVMAGLLAFATDRPSIGRERVRLRLKDLHRRQKRSRVR